MRKEKVVFFKSRIIFFLCFTVVVMLLPLCAYIHHIFIIYMCVCAHCKYVHYYCLIFFSAGTLIHSIEYVWVSAHCDQPSHRLFAPIGANHGEVCFGLHTFGEFESSGSCQAGGGMLLDLIGIAVDHNTCVGVGWFPPPKTVWNLNLARLDEAIQAERQCSTILIPTSPPMPISGAPHKYLFHKFLNSENPGGFQALVYDSKFDWPFTLWFHCGKLLDRETVNVLHLTLRSPTHKSPPLLLPLSSHTPNPHRFPLPAAPPQFDHPCVHLTPQAPRCATSGPPGAPCFAPAAPSGTTLVHPIFLQCTLEPLKPNPPLLLPVMIL
ncbi:hypothetical protein VP01_1268g2 [Puccinia sorghi]|uniref:Uncharacterized protein n=1 Tax=Puccinia sorghi TaxID=27349 RepID=A0A0L6VNZ6_9BASI|nr:hypothetical protein VP01_1268g2 [Puccinia sorghi]